MTKYELLHDLEGDWSYIDDTTRFGINSRYNPDVDLSKLTIKKAYDYLYAKYGLFERDNIFSQIALMISINVGKSAAISIFNKTSETLNIKDWKLAFIKDELSNQDFYDLLFDNLLEYYKTKDSFKKYTQGYLRRIKVMRDYSLKDVRDNTTCSKIKRMDNHEINRLVKLILRVIQIIRGNKDN
jgi:hypothetical protein